MPAASPLAGRPDHRLLVGIGRRPPATSPPGWTVYATARRPETLADLEAAGCRTLALDVTDEASMQAAVAAVEEEHGAVGVLVNNAGYSQSGAIETVPLERVRAQFETNVFGLVRMCQLVLPAMRAQRWGKIVNVSSMGGRFTFPGGGALPREQARGRGDLRRAALRGPRLRRRRDRRRAGDHPHRLRRDGRAIGGRGRGDGPYAEFDAAVATPRGDVYEKGPLGRLGGPPEAVAERIEKAITAEPARAPATR